jgi:hypothetical protein
MNALALFGTSFSVPLFARFVSSEKITSCSCSRKNGVHGLIRLRTRAVGEIHSKLLNEPPAGEPPPAQSGADATRFANDRSEQALRPAA